MSRQRRELSFFALPLAAFCAMGCTSPHQSWQSLKGDGFSGWNDQLGAGLRSNKEAKPSGYFTDKRSDQIEQDLGGF